MTPADRTFLRVSAAPLAGTCLSGFDGVSWRELSRATTIGDARLDRFEPLPITIGTFGPSSQAAPPATSKTPER